MDLKQLILDNNLIHTTIHAKRQEFISKIGQKNSNIYYIESGAVRIYVEDNLEERIVRFGYRGNLITPLDSYITNQPTVYNIQAIKKSVIHVISKKSIIECFSQDSEFMSHWITTLEDLVFQQLEREIDLLTASPAERYLRVLKRSPHIFQEIPHKHIANYLRMTPETLSRLKKS